MSVAANGLIIVVPPWLLVVAAMICAVYVVWWRGFLPKHWQPVSADVDFAGLGKLTIAPDTRDSQIAHSAWVELATRKAGVPFDRDHDIIIEIYNSWYELFGRLRELARECPATRLRRDANTRRLVWSLTQVLNDGLRPHLTRWHGRFRRWYTAAVAEAPPGKTPQEIQRDYPEYAELVDDLVKVQDGMRRYMSLLRTLATGES